MTSQLRPDRRQSTVFAQTSRRHSGYGCGASVMMAAVLLLVAYSASASPPTTEFLPQSSSVLSAENKVAKKGQTMVTGILKCHHKPLFDASKGRAYSAATLSACLQGAKLHWLNGVSGLVPRDRGARDVVTLPDALKEVGGADGAFDEIDIELKRAAGKIFCCGSTPLPGDFSGKVPDPSGDSNCTFSNIDKANKILGKLAKDLHKCHMNLVNNASKGKPFSLDTCETQAQTNFDTKISKLKGLPACTRAALSVGRESLSGVVDELTNDFHSESGQWYSEGTPLDPRGCCQTAALKCTDVVDATGCASPSDTFVLGGTCNTATGVCTPHSCRDTNTDCNQNPDLNCRSCPEACGECFVCGDGKCSGLETCTNCPQDCGACYCGNGTCDPGEACNSEPSFTCFNCCCSDCGCGDGSNSTCGGTCHPASPPYVTDQCY